MKHGIRRRLVLGLSQVLAIALSTETILAAEPVPPKDDAKSNSEIPRIVVDEAHHALDRAESPDYELSPSDRLVIDASGYEWKVPANAPKGRGVPDTVQVLIKDMVYSYPWKPDRARMTIPAPGGMQFQGEAPFRLEPGTKGAVGIGLQTVSESKEVRFIPFWFAGFLVK